MKKTMVMGLSFLLALTVAADAFGQGRQTGTISGAAVDAQGLSLPGVTITVSSPSLQGTRTAITDINGNYSLPQLPPGDYSVVFVLSGFGDVEETATVPLGGEVGVNAVMAPGGVTEVVEVVGVVPAEIQTTETASNMVDDEVNVLPMGRTPFGHRRDSARAEHQYAQRRAARDQRGVRLRQRLPGGRRRHERQPVRHVERALRRRRDRGDTGAHLRDLGRVRAVLRRRRQRHHEERRQHVLRELAYELRQPDLGGAQPLRGGERGGADGYPEPDARSDARRSDRARPPLVLHLLPSRPDYRERQLRADRHLVRHARTTTIGTSSS